MLYNLIRSRNFTIYLLFLFFSFTILMIVSIDSPLHSSYRHVDSAWFFMEGKSLMNGLIPYKDCADSKGPLIYLFYGIAYLISPTNYYGVYILHSICFSFVFFILFRTAQLLIQERCKTNKTIKPAICSALLMGLVFFTYCHNEMRCEDLCQLSLSYLIYSLVTHILHTKNNSRHEFIHGLFTGIAIMSVLLIKWNIAIYYSLLPIAVIIIMFLNQKTGFVHYLIGIFSGCLAIIIPICLYFFYHDALEIMIKEYFLNTSKTFSNENHNWLINFTLELRAAFLSIRVIGFIAMFAPIYFFKSNIMTMNNRILRIVRYIPTLCGIMMFFAFTYGKGGDGYYHSGYTSWFIFSTCLVSIYLCSIKIIRQVMIPFVIMSVIAFNTAYAWRYQRNIILKPEHEHFDTIERKLASLHKPTILHWDYFEIGVGISAEALPASSYWAIQTGGSSFQKAQQTKIIESRISDIVTVQSASPDKRDLAKETALCALNYSYIGSVKDYFGIWCNIYIKNELLPIINHSDT